MRSFWILRFLQDLVPWSCRRRQGTTDTPASLGVLLHLDKIICCSRSSFCLAVSSLTTCPSWELDLVDGICPNVEHFPSFNGEEFTPETGDLSLEDSLKNFEQGVVLTRQCQIALSEAEQKIMQLTADDNYQSEKPLD